MTGSCSSILQLLIFSGIALGLFIICLVVGLFLYTIELNNKTKTYFLNSFLGLFTLICLYSFFIVGYKTINILSFSVLLYLFYKGKNKLTWKRIDLKTLVPVFYIFPVIFILYGCYQLTTIENDLRFYAKIATALTRYKQENVYHFYNTYNSEFNGVMPYHYIEMWLTSVFRILFNLKSIISLKYITFPFFISSVTYGIMGLFNKNKFMYFLLFIALSSFPFYLVSILKSGFIVYTDFWLRPTFILYYYSLLALFYLIYEKKWELVFLSGIIIGATSVIIVPCLYSGLFAISLWAKYKKEITNIQFVRLNSFLLISLLISFFIYSKFSPTINLYSQHPFLEIFMTSIKIWKAAIYAITTLLLESGALLLASFLFNRFSIHDKNYSPIHIFVLAQLLSGIVLFQVLNQLDNSYQFPYFAYAGAGLILIIFILLVIDKVENLFVKWGFSIFVVLCGVYLSYSNFDFHHLSTSLESNNLMKNNVSKNWVERVKGYFAKNENAKGGFVWSKKDLPSHDPKSRNCLTYQTGSFICYITDNCNLPSLTCKDTLVADKTPGNEQNFEKVESWIKAFPKFTAECDVSEYLRKGNLDFFICTKNKLLVDTAGFHAISDKESKYVLVYKN